MLIMSHRPTRPEFQKPLLFSETRRFGRSTLSRLLKPSCLHRVNVLGSAENSNSNYHVGGSGHTGCVNALSWAQEGELLLSGGDDRTVRIWRGDMTFESSVHQGQQYAYGCTSIIQTGHRANIFNVQMLQHSSRIATVAGDKQVRVFDLNHDYNRHGSCAAYCTRILRCHEDRVKRIVVEDRPDLFLTVSEDGSVRQHDLRTSHQCTNGPCPTPLVQMDHELSTIAVSPLTPHYLVVAGDSPYGYLFDRRHVGRLLHEEWGIPRSSHGHHLTTCVRQFGKPKKPLNGRLGRDHITGARMSVQNGHEVLLSYSGDAVYLFSTNDDPTEGTGGSASSLLPSAASDYNGSDKPHTIDLPSYNIDDGIEEDNCSVPADVNTPICEDSDSDSDAKDQPHRFPTILPRRRYHGARNVATIKDVNFLGPNDEYVVSGSDDGYFFIWDKKTTGISGIYEGDSAIVNVIEGHPRLPLIAVSGIDTTIKLFAPSPDGVSTFSRLANVERIMENNLQDEGGTNFRFSMGVRMATLLNSIRTTHTANGPAIEEECPTQ
ncbi:WD40-repeat-containing domain protein [Infundibulicybe gibba]|nr:WD40-repeat-containing domain protein [Infundibulicybe gibba]